MFQCTNERSKKSLASKTEVNNALDLGDKNRKKHLNCLIQVTSTVKVILKKMKHKNI